MTDNSKARNKYEDFAKLSFVNKDTFSYRNTVETTKNNFFDCANTKDFYIDTLFYLHLYTGIYYELVKYNIKNKNNIQKFKELIQSLKIEINNTLTTNIATPNNIIIQLDINNKFKIDLNAFNNYALTTDYNNYYDTTGILSLNTDKNNEEYKKYFPVLENIQKISNTNLINATAGTLNTLYGYQENKVNQEYDKNSSVSSPNPNGIYDSQERKHKLEKTLYEILNQKHENIMGYLLFYKIYYHIILYNINIVDTIRTNFLNNTCLTTTTGTQASINEALTTVIPACVDIKSSTSIFTTAGSAIYVVDNINKIFGDMLTNITLLNKNNFSYNTDFLEDKFKYTAQIVDLNKIRDEYQKVENALNSVLKDYNKYLKNFNRLKSYANFIIIFLIIIIGLTILITLLGSLSGSFKNYYYLISFILLAFFTYMYYDNFKHINLYEEFVSTIWNGNSTTDNSNTYICSNIILPAATYSRLELSAKSIVKGNINDLYNGILFNMNSYNTAINDIFNNLRNNIYTIGNKVFSQDANTYLYKLYLHKKQLTEVSRMKKINLTNLIETMKKQVIYLFNIILLISLFTLILLFGLLLFSTLPFYLPYIIAICVILIIIVILYFIYAIVQPTRMIANKNYWANVNPYEGQIKKLK